MNHPLMGRSQHGLEILVCEREKEAECVIIRRSGQQNQQTFSVSRVLFSVVGAV